MLCFSTKDFSGIFTSGYEVSVLLLDAIIF